MKTVLKRISLILLSICFLFSLAQAGVIEDAKDAINKEKYEARVTKAKKLLKAKEEKENEIKEIEEKLKKLETNEEVTINDDTAYISFGDAKMTTNAFITIREQ
jgi:hypothetical protein